MSFERREDIHDVAQDNLRGFGCPNVDLVRGDFREGISGMRCDLLFLDLARPQEYLVLARDSLKPGGHVIAYAPFLEDGTGFCRDLTNLGFLEVRLTEIHRREFEVLPSASIAWSGVRP